MGLQDGRISNSQLSSPNHYERLYVGGGESADMNPGCARLNNRLAWCSPANKYSDIPVYIEIDLNKSMDISEITTQGFRAAVNAYYVMQYNVSFSNDRVTWKLYKEVKDKLNIYYKISGSTCLHNHFFRIFLPPKA